MSEVKFMRLNATMFESSKLKFIRTLEYGDETLLVWLTLIAKAGKCDTNGMIIISNKIPYTVKLLADETKIDEEIVEIAIDTLEQLDIASKVNKKMITEEWQEYEYKGRVEKVREQNRIRQRARRERLKNELLTGKSQQMILSCVQATNKVTHTEQPKEEPKEKKKPKAKPKEQTVTDPYFEDEKLNSTFKDFMDMRKSLKDGKMTERAIKMMIKKLNKYDTETAIAMLERSILNNWKDVYEITEKRAYNNYNNSYNNSYNKPQQKSISQMCDDIMNDFSMGDAW